MKMNERMRMTNESMRMQIALEIALWRFVRLQREGAEVYLHWAHGPRFRAYVLHIDEYRHPADNSGFPPEFEAMLVMAENTTRYVEVSWRSTTHFSGMGRRSVRGIGFESVCTTLALDVTLMEYWAVRARHPSWWRWMPVLPWAPGRIK